MELHVKSYFRAKVCIEHNKKSSEHLLQEIMKAIREQFLIKILNIG